MIAKDTAVLSPQNGWQRAAHRPIVGEDRVLVGLTIMAARCSRRAVSSIRASA